MASLEIDQATNLESHVDVMALPQQHSTQVYVGIVEWRVCGERHVVNTSSTITQDDGQ